MVGVASKSGRNKQRGRNVNEGEREGWERMKGSTGATKYGARGRTEERSESREARKRDERNNQSATLHYHDKINTYPSAPSSCSACAEMRRGGVFGVDIALFSADDA